MVRSVQYKCRVASPRPVSLTCAELDRQLRQLGCSVPESLAGVLPEDLEIVLDAARKLREDEKKPSR